jgi:Mn-containing catalase
MSQRLHAQDASVRQLLDDFAAEEVVHVERC